MVADGNCVMVLVKPAVEVFPDVVEFVVADLLLLAVDCG